MLINVTQQWHQKFKQFLNFSFYFNIDKLFYFEDGLWKLYTEISVFDKYISTTSQIPFIHISMICKLLAWVFAIRFYAQNHIFKLLYLLMFSTSRKIDVISWVFCHRSGSKTLIVHVVAFVLFFFFCLCHVQHFLWQYGRSK